ncbi:diguanylate cyclase [Butyrivibrio sp. WCD2001]|uniref:diguanylate cyclase n=1 Tax=Butyrivibrio sp. WCD2001 TaxID=1280681 RepID=UPI00040D1E1B|nr:GGDEF domain-containing protein [Butyrivibrio sp. WCD2001]
MIAGKKIIALCTYRIYDSQVFSFTAELNELLKAADSRLFIYAMNAEIGNVGNAHLAEASVFDLIPYDKVDAIIIMDEKIKCRELVERIIDKANSHEVPAIIVDGEYDNVSHVKFDYAKGFEAIVRHIIEFHKPKHPHFMAGKPDSEFSNERLEVFKKVIEENGFTFDNSMVSYGDFWSIPSRAAAKELLKRDVIPDAVICANDIMAINVCDVFSSHGINTPDQVLISGFDGLDEAFLSSPGITTAICDSATLANTVMKVINGVLRGEKNITEWITPSFMANESCGCPRCQINWMSTVQGFNNRFYHHQDDVYIMQDLTSNIMASDTMADCIWHLSNSVTNSITKNMCLIVEDACFNIENNYFLEDMEKTTRSVIYNSYSDTDEIFPYNEEDIIPNLDDIMERGYPIIFNVLEYMGKDIGFVCYSFNRYDLIDYSRTPSLTNCLGMGFGGYVTIRYQKYLRDKIQRMYQNDALTGLYNRLAFLSKLEELKDAPQNSGQKLTIIMTDLNGLKEINDNLGHAAGDRAIATVAKVLKSVCPKGSLCVRFGGDEMLALVPGECNSCDIIAKMEEKLKEESEKLGYTVSSSYGAYSTIFDEFLDLDKIIAMADEQMYKMKKRNKQNKKNNTPEN